ncbi:MAG TPA: GYD domain-containing protein [Candidatus Dormibacteraeota bacterium]|nr:GYD domain-containing protein [Candidatus Dormibacteraeota bacterium]
MIAVMQFITMVRIRPGGADAEIGSRVAAHAAQWEHLQRQIHLVGGRINQTWTVLGNDYDLMFLGEADDHRTLHRIDAVCEAEGYASKTHPAIEAAEYARLVKGTADVLSYGGNRRDGKTEWDEA